MNFSVWNAHFKAMSYYAKTYLQQTYRTKPQRIWLGGILLFLCIGGLYTLDIFGLRPHKGAAWRAMPQEAVIVFETPWSDSLGLHAPQSYAPTQTLRAWQPWQTWQDDVAYFDKLLADAGISTHADTRLYSGLQRVQAHRVGWVHALAGDATLNTAVAQRAEASFTYKGETVYTWSDSLGMHAFTYVDGIQIYARQAHLIEFSIEVLHNASASSSLAQPLQAAAIKQKRLRIHLRLDAIDKLWTAVGTSLIGHLPFMEMGIPSTPWHLDVYFSKKAIHANSYLPKPKTSASPWYRLLTQAVQKPSILPQYTPTSTALAYAYSVPKPSIWMAALEKDSLSVLSRNLFAQVRQELLFGVSAPSSPNTTPHRFAVVPIKDVAATKALLEDWRAALAAEESDTYQNFTIHRLPSKPQLGQFVGRANWLIDPYYTWMDSVLIFANSRATLERWIEQYNFEQVLAKTAKSLTSAWQNQSSIYTYINTSKAFLLLQPFLQAKQLREVATQFTGLHALSPVGVQIKGSASEPLLSVQIGYNPTKETDKQALWRKTFNAEIKTFSALSLATGDLRFFVQDARHVLYCLDSGGNILWQRNLKGALLGKVQRLDFRRDGSEEFFFSTARHLYLVDTHGENAEAIYPRPLNTPKRTATLLIDYGKGWRLFWGDSEGQLQAWDKNSVPLVGWTPWARIGLLREAPQYMYYKNIDCIITYTEASKVQCYRTDGSLYKSIQFLRRGGANLYVDTHAARAVSGSSSGRIQVANLETGGRFELPNDKALGKQVSFLYEDVQGDAKKEYIRWGKNHLCIHHYDEDGKFKKLLDQSYNFTADVFFPVHGKDNKCLGFGLLNTETQQIYFLNTQGQLHAAFPLLGAHPFTYIEQIHQQRAYMLTADKNTLYAYTLNPFTYE